MLKDVLGALAVAHPLKHAIRCGDLMLTYEEMFIMKDRVKKYLADELRIQNGDKIALYLPNCADFIYSFFSAAEIGAVTIPLNTNFKESELRYYISKCGIKTIITHSDLLVRWGQMPLKEKTPNFVLMDQLEWPSVDFKADSLLKSSHISPDVAAIDSEILYLCTSGSSGRPKIIPKTPALLFSGAENLGTALDVDSQDRFLCVTPLFHANGFENSMFLPIIKGALLVLMREFSPRSILDVLEQEEITVLIGSPFIFSSLCDCADRAYDFSAMRHCLSAGAPLPVEMKKKFYDTFGIKVREHYGASETGPVSIQFQDADGIGAVGKPLNNVRVRILDEKGRQLPPDVTGEVFVSSTSMVKGYLDEPELSSEAFPGGYFRTGDLGMLDSEGNLHIVGRNKAIINVAGIKIDPAEIRNTLLLYPKVKDAYVTGVKNRRGMEFIKAIIVAHPDCTAKDIVTFCKDRLAAFKIPRVIEFMDSIPVDVMGKVIRSAVEQ
ncbi:MAG TPA: class I adenylate-forming enzyme family protein [Thermodesulfovibrionales bacterium]|jgi:long-chain acyl-CoA synthetase|nr:class I adenylate-forming enzyme family protein [Thermodesulfovibrionales bacterium]